jgi:hypothetical protein
MRAEVQDDGSYGGNGSTSGVSEKARYAGAANDLLLVAARGGKGPDGVAMGGLVGTRHVQGLTGNSGHFS